ncbi:MAG: RNA 2',3'-cyclic phosphodiesterase [Eubacteriales bacterium]|jgi:2'-5' RNA ligase|nr:RNA 2',3'-cyclic phosphodiesterase [Eubacteriales bacterium]
MRLFVALMFNDEILNNLCEVIVNLRTQSLKGNFSSRSQLHTTLAFIGETDEPEKAIDAMNSVTVPPFTIQVGGYGIFKKRTGNIHWAGIKLSPELERLREQLIAALKENGFSMEMDNAEYKPHLTLGREVQTITSFNPASFSRSVPKQEQTVGEIVLMKSEHIDGKLTYTPVHTKKL